MFLFFLALQAKVLPKIQRLHPRKPLIKLRQQKAIASKKEPITLNQQILVVDVDTGEVLYSKDAKKRMAPSSMTKIMTILYTLNLIKQGKIALSDKVKTPDSAYRTEGTTMFLEKGQELTIDELLQGIAIVSANDGSKTLAIHISGDERTFSNEMTQYAKRIGAKNTQFLNASGLPEEGHYTTPYDLALISMHLMRNFKESYDLFSHTIFSFNSVTQMNKKLDLVL